MMSFLSINVVLLYKHYAGALTPGIVLQMSDQFAFCSVHDFFNPLDG